MKVQVIYPIHNIDKYAKKRLYCSYLSLLKQKTSHSIKFHIIDTSAKKQNLELPNNNYTHLHYPLQNFSRSKSINLGLKYFVDGRFFIASDIDIIFLPNFIESSMRYMNLYRVSLVWPTLELITKSKNRYIKREREIFKNGINEYLYNTGDESNPSGFSIKYGPANFIRTEAAFNVNGFDESFIGRGFQDHDFYLRLKQSEGLYKIPFNINGSFTYHLSHEKNLSNDFKDYIRNFIKFQKTKKKYVLGYKNLNEIGSILCH